MAEISMQERITRAKNGNAVAQYNLGICYENGWDVEQNYEQAAYWYKKAAEQGLKEAQEALTSRGLSW